MKWKDTPWKESYDQPRQHIKKQRHCFVKKDPSSQGYGFSYSHVWMWMLDYKESWALKNWCFWTVVFEKSLESPLDCKEIQPLNPKGNEFLIFFGRTDVEAETTTLWALDAKNWLIRKDPDAGKDWRQEEKGDGITDSTDMSLSELQELVMEQGGQVYCSPWVKRSKTQLSDWNELNWSFFCPSLCTSYLYTQ